MRSKTLVVLGLIIAAAPFSFADRVAPVNCTHLLGWLAGEAPTHSLTRAIDLRGSDLSLTPKVEAQLRNAGATSELLDLLRRVKPKSAYDSRCRVRHLSSEPQL